MKVLGKSKLTPGMRQYLSVKKDYKDAIVLFRMGDFYETFYEDAKVVAKELNIVLTSRGKGAEGPIPLAGVPYHALDTYLAKLVRKGYKVVICEQVEDPKKAKGLVKRDVVRVVTPGTVIEDSILDGRENNYLMALTTGKGKTWGLAFLELSTGEFFTTQLEDREEKKPAILTEVARFGPAEVVMPEGMREKYGGLAQSIRDLLDQVSIHYYVDSEFLPAIAEETVREQFNIMTLQGLGLEDKKEAVGAAGAVLAYAKDLQRNELDYIDPPRVYSVGDKMILDYTTVRNLELLKNIVDGSEKGTLLSCLDHCVTPMGARQLRKWMLNPEVEVGEINQRLDAVSRLLKGPKNRDKIRAELEHISDLERIISRIAYGNANAKDVISLKGSLEIIPGLRHELDLVLKRKGETDKDSLGNEVDKGGGDADKLASIREAMEPLKDVVETVATALVDDPPATLREGGLIKPGHDPRLDELKDGIRDAKNWIEGLEESERERTGIKSLRVGFNKVFGYYLEVTKAHTDKVPEDYVRKQTLVNSERYITEELKEKESVVLSAQEKIHELEYELFCKLREELAGHRGRIVKVAGAVSKLDVLANFAFLAQVNGYKRPTVDYGDQIRILEGRHAVVERLLEHDYVPNDTALDKKNRIAILTGPNMSGKSTYMRQVATIVILAQTGCFVPASNAKVGVVDRIFTRVGAHDDLLRGHSTFMVEMVQLANILNNATPRSLIIMDEVGRGTSTYDGLSLAWSVVEHLHFRIKGAKVLFATHYHHLCELEKVYPDVHNYNILVEERGDDIVFLRKIVPGATDRSYGIEVAQLAGVPVDVVERAKDILKRIEEESEIELKDADLDKDALSVKVSVKDKDRARGKKVKTYTQYVLFPFEEKRGEGDVERILRDLEVDKLTPVEALNKLNELKKKVEKR